MRPIKINLVHSILYVSSTFLWRISNYYYFFHTSNFTGENTSYVFNRITADTKINLLYLFAVFNMKAVLCLLIFSVAIAIILAENYDDGEYEEDEEYELVAEEDTDLSPLQLNDGLEDLQYETTVDKRGRRRGKGRGRKNRKNRKQKNLKQDTDKPNEEDMGAPDIPEKDLPVIRKGKKKVGRKYLCILFLIKTFTKLHAFFKN